jgi:PPM family protein phosphatase
MPQQSRAQFEAISALIQGGRDHQEDAVVADFPMGADSGIVVLADGMGGHAAGDIASKIVMTEVYSELKFQSTDPDAFSRHMPEILKTAAHAANDCVRAHIEENPEATGMGSTLVAAVTLGDTLYWISVGDSPLYLFRDGDLVQLNEDHSMAPQIDLMASSGMISEEEARHHQDRNALLSVLAGDDIPRIDCPAEGLKLRDADVIVVASDGLQFLDNDEIEAVLSEEAGSGGAAVARSFLDRIAELDDPDQDNTSFAVIRVHLADATVGSVAADERATGDAEVAPDADAMPDNVEVLTFYGDDARDAKEAQIRPRRVSVDGEQIRNRPPRAEAQ